MCLVFDILVFCFVLRLYRVADQLQRQLLIRSLLFVVTYLTLAYLTYDTHNKNRFAIISIEFAVSHYGPITSYNVYFFQN